MNVLHEIQPHVTNRLTDFRPVEIGGKKYPQFPGMQDFMHLGYNKKREGHFEEKRYRVPSLDFFNGYLLAGNVGGERPSDYAKSVQYYNFLLQREGAKAAAFGFDVEPLRDENGRVLQGLGNQKNFEKFLDAVASSSPQFLLLHVTDPYKTHAYEYVKKWNIQATESAKISGVVNPFFFDENGRVHADNVDGYAMLRAIEDRKQVRGSTILLVGAGGAASSIALEALSRIDGGRLIIANRTESRAVELGDQLRDYYKGLDEKQLIAGGVGLIEKYAPESDILISALTGENPYMTIDLAKSVPADTLFADVNYGKTARAAVVGKETGHESIDGGPMVYYGFERAAEIAFEGRLKRKINVSTFEILKKEIGLR